VKQAGYVPDKKWSGRWQNQPRSSWPFLSSKDIAYFCDNYRICYLSIYKPRI